jgi:hypothetical protein
MSRELIFVLAVIGLTLFLFVLRFVLRRIFYKAGDVIENKIAGIKNAKSGGAEENLADRYTTAPAIKKPKTLPSVDMQVWNAGLYRITFLVNAVLLVMMGTVAAIAPNRIMRGGLSFGGSVSYIPRLRTPYHDLITMQYDFVSIHIVIYFIPIALLLVFFCFLLIYSWRGMGNAQLLKRTAMMAIVMPVGYILYDFIVSMYLWSAVDIAYWMWLPLSQWLFYGEQVIALPLFIIVSIAPFVCVYRNVKKCDKSLSLGTAIMIWKQ